MLIDTRTKSRAYGRHQKQGLWKALRFCAFFCLDLAALTTLCRGLAPSKEPSIGGLNGQNHPHHDHFGQTL